MPRPTSRAFMPYLRVFLAIAQDETQPPALRLRAAELGLAIRSGVWEVAAGNKAATRAVRSIVAADNIDKQLLALVKEVKRETSRLANALESPEAKQQREFDALIARATEERTNAGE